MKESVLYVNLEPCCHFGQTPPCCDLIIANKIPRVVIGCIDPFKKVSGKGNVYVIEAVIDTKTGEIVKRNKISLYNYNSTTTIT